MKENKIYCNHIWECGCNKNNCEECLNHCEDDFGICEDEECEKICCIDMCEDEDCKCYYKYRNDNCNCSDSDCPYCNYRRSH